MDFHVNRYRLPSSYFKKKLQKEEDFQEGSAVSISNKAGFVRVYKVAGII